VPPYGTRDNARLEHLVTLRELLAEARDRGEAFERAWRRAVRLALRHVRGSWTRTEWSAALEAARHAWHDSYHGNDVLTALPDLTLGLDRHEDVGATWGRQVIVR
jgi:hypothetical protein